MEKRNIDKLRHYTLVRAGYLDVSCTYFLPFLFESIASKKKRTWNELGTNRVRRRYDDEIYSVIQNIDAQVFTEVSGTYFCKQRRKTKFLFVNNYQIECHIIRISKYPYKTTMYKIYVYSSRGDIVFVVASALFLLSQSSLIGQKPGFESRACG